MVIIYSAKDNEMVRVNLSNNPTMMVNVYEQEDGILICLDDDVHHIEALINDKSAGVMATYDKVINSKESVLEVDSLYIGGDETVEPEAEDEDWQ